MKVRFLASVAILLALIVPVRADEVADEVCDPVVPAQADEGAVQVRDPVVPAQADEGAVQVRDPFWPVGYTSEGQTTSVVVAEVELVEKPEMKPISQEDWDKARAKLPRADGIFIGSHPVSKEKVEKMMMGGKVYYAGDPLYQTNEFVAFTWKIDTISFKSTKYEISPVTAERVVKESK